MLTIAFLLGPRVAVDTTVTFDPESIGDDPQAYIARQEAAVPDIRPGQEKEIVWARPLIRAKTPISI
ncbi:alpha/beta hydrolase, partial [Rhizobiaceae sp. 2RAB30]